MTVHPQEGLLQQAREQQAQPEFRAYRTQRQVVEHRLARALLAKLGTVVTRDALSRAGWPEGAPGRNALDVHVLRLRRRLAPLHLTIHTVRSRGYLLEMSAPATGRVSG